MENGEIAEGTFSGEFHRGLSGGGREHTQSFLRDKEETNK